MIFIILRFWFFVVEAIQVFGKNSHTNAQTVVLLDLCINATFFYFALKTKQPWVSFGIYHCSSNITRNSSLFIYYPNILEMSEHCRYK